MTNMAGTMTACLTSKAAARKTIKLSKEAEPEIYNAIRRDALLENVTVREDGTIDFDDGSKNREHPAFLIRSITSIKSLSRFQSGSRNESYLPDRRRLWCAAAGFSSDCRSNPVPLPSGFTAKLAGTERGITEPTPTFLRLLRRGISVAAPRPSTQKCW